MTRPRFVPLFALITILVAACGCDKIRFNVSNATSGIQGSGVAIDETRELDPFEAIDVSGAGTVTIRIGEPQSFAISGDDNIVPLISTTVEDGRLVIKPSESISPKTDLEYVMTVREISQVEVAGAVRVELPDYQGETLELNLRGACSCSGSGSVKTLVLDVKGASSSNLEDLVAESVVVNLAGAGQASVHATRSIDASASGVGQINCTGNPSEVKKSANGLAAISVD